MVRLRRDAHFLIPVVGVAVYIAAASGELWRAGIVCYDDGLRVAVDSRTGFEPPKESLAFDRESERFYLVTAAGERQPLDLPRAIARPLAVASAMQGGLFIADGKGNMVYFLEKSGNLRTLLSILGHDVTIAGLAVGPDERLTVSLEFKNGTPLTVRVVPRS